MPQLDDGQEAPDRRSQLLLEMLDEAPAGVTVHPIGGNFLYVNRYMARVHGYTAEEFLRKGVADLVIPEDRHVIEEARSLLQQSGEATFDIRHRRKDGSVVPLRTHARHVQWEGQPTVLSVTLDRTEPMRVEEALRESEQRYRGLFEQSPLGIYRTTPDGRILSANPALVAMLGYTSFEELASRDLEAGGFDPEYPRSRFRELIDRDSEVRGFETIWTTKDGRWRYVREHAVAFRGPDGAVAYYDGTVEDITDQKLAQEALRASEARLRSILDNLQDAHFRADLSGRFVAVSRSAPRMYGYDTVEEMIGLPADVLYADPEVRGPMLEELRRSGHIEDWIGRALRKDGSIFWVSMNVQTFRDEAGNIVGTEGLVRDITERRHADEERRRLEATVAQSDRLASMGLLAAGVAHEINNPLAYTILNLESLAEDLPEYIAELTALGDACRGCPDLPEAVRASMKVLEPHAWSDFLDRLKDAAAGARKIKDIARGLSTFARVEPERLEPVDLRQAILSALSMAQNEIKYRARVEKDLAPIDPVLASEGRLSQVFLNLVVNAAHSIPEGDVEKNRIVVRTWQEGSTVLAEVRDTGAGIPPDQIERIFEPFYTTKPVGFGSGLGLSIVRNILASYQGSIEVASEVGAGSRFLVRLPAASAMLAGPASAVQPPTDLPQIRGRVLVIDDDPGIRSVLRRLLVQHEIFEADSGERGCDLLSTNADFDVILCDMMMPSMSGMDVHRWLLRHHPVLAPRVIFVTGGAFTPGAQEYLRSVDNLTIEKPFDAESLRELVARRVVSVRVPGGSSAGDGAQ